MNTIEVEGLSKQYVLGEDRPGGRLGEAVARSVRRLIKQEPRPRRDSIWALRDVSLHVVEGTAVGVIGANGAGKTTLLKILSRITEPTAGVVRTRGRVTSLLEVGTGFHPELTGRENVYLNGAILGLRKDDISRRFDAIVAFAGMERFIDTPVKRYSSGMYLRLAFAVAAHLEPDIMVVDEVLAVGDAAFQSKCLGRMESTERSGGTVVFVSHNLEAVARLCSRAVWLEGGMIRADGPVSSVIEDYLAAQAQGQTASVNVGPGNGSARLRRVAVMDVSGRERYALRRDQSFVIEVFFWLGSHLPGFDVSIQVTDSRGVEVLNEAWSDAMPNRPSAPGRYLARVTIPPLLNVGEYVVGVWIGTRYDTLLHATSVRRFRLEGDLRGRPGRVLIVDAPWQVTRISEHEGPDTPLLETETDQPGTP